MPESTLKLAKAADAVLLGAVGGPKYDTLPRELRPEQGILGIRKALGLFANLRPAILYPELAGASSLKPEVVAGLNRVSRFLRGRLGHAIDMKFTPDLKFLHDQSFDEAARIGALFDDPRVAQDLTPQPPSDSWKDED